MGKGGEVKGRATGEGEPSVEITTMNRNENLSQRGSRGERGKRQDMNSESRASRIWALVQCKRRRWWHCRYSSDMVQLQD